MGKLKAVDGGHSKLNELSEARLWSALDTITNRLTGIECQLSEVVRLEERVNNHDQVLGRFGSRLDNHDGRLRESELWQANFGDRSSVERTINSVRREIKSLEEKVDIIESTGNVNQGQKDVAKEILKWMVGILAAILAYKLTRT